MKEIKKNILLKFGGGSAVAKICEVTPSAVSRWVDIPSRHQRTLFHAAKRLGIKLKADEFMIPDCESHGK